MAEVGTYYITVMPSMNKFTAAVKSSMGGLGTESGNKFSGGFMDVLKGSALGTLIGNLATKFGSELIQGFDVGVKRLDTLENFPKVMEALGYSAKDASASVKLIMDHLDGLPTTTQDMVTLTQAIADSTGDLDLATRAALGFNDMMLANGASAGEMTQAMGVFNRVLGKGNATTAQWMSLQSVMPAQLALVARELMGEGASVEELRDALNNGEISWNDFLQAIVRLDEEGTEHVASFAEQARANSHGIGTALTNVQNRIGAGWAEILKVFGRENISGIIDKFSYGVRDAMTRVAEALRWLKYTILGTDIGDSVKRIFENVQGFFSSFKIDGSQIRDLARGFIELVDGALKWIADNGELVGLIFSMIAGVVAAIVGFKLAMWFIGVQAAMSAFVSGLGAISVIGTGVIGLIAALVAGLVYFFTQTEMGQKAWAGFVSFLKKAWAGLKKAWADLQAEFKRKFNQIKQNIEDNKLVWKNFVNNVKTFANDMKTKVVQAWNDLKAKITATAIAIKTSVTNTWTALKASVTALVNSIRTGVTNAWNATKTAVTNTVNGIKNAITTAWNTTKTTVTNTVNGIKTTIATTWESIRTTVRQKVEDLRLGIRQKFEDMRLAARQKVEDIKTGLAQKWEAIRSTIRQKLEDARLAIRQKFEDARLAARQKVEDMRSGVVEKLTAISTAASEKAQAVWDAITNTWSGLSTTVSGIFESVKSAITTPINAAKDAVSKAIDTIKGVFNTTLSFPHIKIPHFKIYGGEIPWGIGGKGVAPSITIDWYKKGGVFDTATIIGIGEAGKEAALPLNAKTYAEIARGIVREGAGGGVVISGNTFIVREEADIDRVADRLAAKIRRERWATA